MRSLWKNTNEIKVSRGSKAKTFWPLECPLEIKLWRGRGCARGGRDGAELRDERALVAAELPAAEHLGPRRQLPLLLLLLLPRLSHSGCRPKLLTAPRGSLLLLGVPRGAAGAGWARSCRRAGVDSRRLPAATERDR